ncbi:phosphoadenylyl-sulfate reductase [Geothermobacter hydrogeniphilus]|uniref:Adenosine 5'-phosphosulfate reductase n=1 Tax=Geothermobacter hydrogeniphilus TaxID=1969733 RepID=A0A1X0XIP0_9BACT|nr:phosphoadenylyl-sulfate reductase [Geothermobacter hydrogeniphilus]ORJ52764.1 phosphoadenosine phosphosulfate reductase [Geothermobacter hydrogeniphilus]
MGHTAARLTTNDPPAAEEILRQGIAQAGGPVALACSFSVEDVAVIDLATRAGLPLGVFAIDTGRLPEETYIVAETVSQRYGLSIEWYFPQAEAVQQLERQKGLFSFRESLENRHQCCAVRKVEPLRRALSGLSGWVTGMRRAQSVTRNDILPIEVDRAHDGLLKINPLCDWSERQLWDYAREQRIPIHKLHRQGYPSIGCAPCTRAVKEGEDVRAGRWWWENPEHKECGLHR